jgi:hypothetical protein
MAEKGLEQHILRGWVYAYIDFRISLNVGTPPKKSAQPYVQFSFYNTNLSILECMFRSSGVHYHAVISPNFKTVIMKHPVGLNLLKERMMTSEIKYGLTDYCCLFLEH